MSLPDRQRGPRGGLLSSRSRWVIGLAASLGLAGPALAQNDCNQPAAAFEGWNLFDLAGAETSWFGETSM